MSKLLQAVWVSWRHRAESSKKVARKTDSDLAAEISGQLGYEVSRATVNHWFRNRRDPSLTEFMALCAALGDDPAQILFNVRMAFQALPGGSAAAHVLREAAPTPEYLQRSAKRLRPSAKPSKAKVKTYKS